MSTYDVTTQNVPTSLKSNDILNCPYSGKVQTVKLPPGKYRLEVWGAQGGYRSSSSYGGLGGYAKGEISLDDKTDVFLYTGGSGNTGGVNGGFNGGGKRSSYNGGGGASDVRIGTDSLLARVIVAGGGGSDGATSRNGMYGGGTSGGSSSQSYGSGGYGGTQTGNSWKTTTKPTGTSSNSDCYAGFGFGGNGVYYSSGYGGAGGGGWYGGSGSYPDGSGDDDRGGGGGSGFVWTGSNAPTGYLLNSSHYLTNTSLIAGNSSMPSVSGSTETGHSGDGYVRVTVVEIYKSVPDTPGNFRQTGKGYFNISLAWDAVECTGYRLYRDATLIATTTATSFEDTGVAPNQTYRYTLIAYNADGDGDPAELSGSTEKGYAVRITEIYNAAFSVNPVDINTKTTLSLQVREIEKILEPYFYYSSDIFAGEV